MEETMKSVEEEAAKLVEDTVLGQLDEKLRKAASNPWRRSHTYDCERCGEDTNLGEKSKLCGGCITTRLCGACLRQYELDPTVRTNHRAMSKLNIRINANTQGGNADAAVDAYDQYIVHDDELLAYTLTWLATPPPKVKAQEPNAER